MTVQQQKNPYTLKPSNTAHMRAGAVHGTAWELEEVRGNSVKTMLTLAAISTVASLQVFGKDRLIFWRESASGGFRVQGSEPQLLA